ncbi:MAG: dTMP kinase [Fimbriimonadaceae bacterium]
MFVTFEGPEGAGKSTAITSLAQVLSQRGFEVLVTREPGSGEVGTKIRAILLEGEAISPTCELFLFLADRSQHVAAVVLPALAKEAIVLCDRFADSTLAYQGYGRGLDLERLRQLNDDATGGLQPELTLLFDLPVEIGIERQSKRDRMDRESLDFHERVRAGFLTEASLAPARYSIIDATQSQEAVFADALNAILERITHHD